MKHTEYYQQVLADVETRLNAHPNAFEFTGDDIQYDDGTLPSPTIVVDVNLKLIDGSQFDLTAQELARLFLIPNGATIRFIEQKHTSPDGALPGLYIKNSHRFNQTGHETNVGIYHLGNADRGLYIDHLFYDDLKTPARFATVGFALLALEAFRHGFTEIELLAGGGAGQHASEWGIEHMIGYKIWPRFGFDALLEEGETNGFPHLSNCQTVSEVIAIDPDWWNNAHGNGRIMTFRLEPLSQSWVKLLNYLNEKGI